LKRDTGMKQDIIDNPSLLRAIIKVTIFLSGIQVIRLIFYHITALAGAASGLYPPFGDIINGVSILFAGVVLCVLFRPSRSMIGLTGFFGSLRTRVVEIIGTSLFLILAGINLILHPDKIVPTFVSCLIFPLFEESLFRGWIWNKISPCLPKKQDGIFTAILVSVLFAIWHLGYWDVVALHMKAESTMATMLHVMLMKMVIASIIGIFAGMLRWKTGNISASILFHAAWNLFGR
jgi:uncharacterized protein